MKSQKYQTFHFYYQPEQDPDPVTISSSGSCKKVLIRPDPDPDTQPCDYVKVPTVPDICINTNIYRVLAGMSPQNLNVSLKPWALANSLTEQILHRKQNIVKVLGHFVQPMDQEPALKILKELSLENQGYLAIYIIRQVSLQGLPANHLK